MSEPIDVKTEHQRFQSFGKKTPRYYTCWEPWFAWYPVHDDYCGWMWLRRVWRKPFMYYDGYLYSDVPQLDSQEIVGFKNLHK